MSFFERHYQTVVHEYLRRVDRSKVVDFYAGNADKFNLQQAKSVISFGPGNGVFDASIVDKCMPNLKEYVGIDPGEYVEEVKGNLLGVNPELKINTFKECAEEWIARECPKISADVIFCLEILKHIPDKRDFLEHCWDLLTPGGTMIVQTWSDEIVFFDFQFEVKTAFDLRNITKEFVTYLFWRDITTEEFQKTAKWLEDYRQRESKNGIYYYNTVAFVMVKP